MWKECTINNNYLISNNGDVKHKITNKILKQKLDKDNYLSVGLSMGARGQRKTVMVHRLVAEAFIPNPDNLPWVQHKDGNTIDNHVDNLEWAVHKKSIKDEGTLSPNSKLTDNQIQYCRLMYKPKDKLYGCRALAKRFGVSKSTISYVVNNKTYK